jgi:mannosylfructose-phosphate synthase
MAVGRLARNKGYDLLILGFSVLAARANRRGLLHLAIGGTSLNKLERPSWAN